MIVTEIEKCTVLYMSKQAAKGNVTNESGDAITFLKKRKILLYASPLLLLLTE